MELDERLSSLQKMKQTLDVAWLLAFRNNELSEMEELAFYCNVVSIKLSTYVEALRRAACGIHPDSEQE